MQPSAMCTGFWEELTPRGTGSSEYQVLEPMNMLFYFYLVGFIQLDGWTGRSLELPDSPSLFA